MIYRSLVENKSEVIFNEIDQIKSQYQVEVGSHRKAWPKSIRSRVIELQRLEFSNRQISERTGISSKTIYSWSSSWVAKLNKQSKKTDSKSLIAVPTPTKFIPVQISNAPSIHPKKSIHGVQKAVLNLDLGNGMKIESVSVEFVVELVHRLKVRV